MEFKLILTPRTPDSFVLNAERPLSGLAFIEQAGACLRRNLDTQTRARHATLGNVSRYEISVPQAIAIDSGWFTKESVRYIPCESNFLADFIFYMASMGSGKMTCYPYYQREVVLTSYIDELRVLEIWGNRGYPVELTTTLGQFDFPLVPDAGDYYEPSEGDMVLDDLLQGNT